MRSPGPNAVAAPLQLAIAFAALIWLPSNAVGQSEASAPRKATEFFQVAPHLSMPWMSEGDVKTPTSAIDTAALAWKLGVKDPALHSALARYFAVATAYHESEDLSRTEGITIDKLDTLARGARAVLNGDDEELGRVVVSGLMQFGVEQGRLMLGANLRMAAEQEHARIWHSLRAHVEKAAGPVTEAPPLGAVVTPAAAQGAGIEFANLTGKDLHHVTLAVDWLTTDKQERLAYHVFIDEWSPNRRVLLPASLATTQVAGRGRMRSRLVYSIWTDELRSEAQVLRAPVSYPRPKGTPRSARPTSIAFLIDYDRQAAAAAANNQTKPRAVQPDPVEALDAASATLDAGNIAAACEAFEKLEATIAARASLPKDVKQQMLDVVRYRWADAVRLRGFAEARHSSKDDRAADTLRKALSLYKQVLDGGDASTDREGDSLHAAALRHSAHLHTILFVGYTRFAKPGGSLSVSAKDHQKAAERAVETLSLQFADAAAADGVPYLKAALQDVKAAQRR